MPNPNYKKLSQEAQQAQRKKDIEFYVNCYKKYLDGNYAPTEKDIDNLVKNQEANEKFFYAKFLQNYIDKRHEANEKIKINKANFSRFVELNVQPPEYAKDEEEAAEFKKHNEEIAAKYADNQEGKENEKIALHNTLSDILNYVPTEFHEGIDGNFGEDFLEKRDKFYTVWNFQSLSTRFGNNHLYMTKDEERICKDKYAVSERAYFAMMEKLFLESSALNNSLPGIDLLSLSDEKLTEMSINLMSDLAMKQSERDSGALDENGLKELADLEKFATEFKELADNIRVYKPTLAHATKGAALFDIVKDYIGKDGFIGKCYNENGESIKFEDAFSEASELGKPIVIGYDGPNKGILPGAFHIYTVDGKIQADYYPTIEAAANMMTGNAPSEADEEILLTRRIAKARVSQIEKNIKSVNKAFGTTQLFKSGSNAKEMQDAINAVANDERKYQINEYAKDFKKYKDSLGNGIVFKDKTIPQDLARMAVVFGKDQVNYDSQEVLDHLVGMVKDYDIGWIMNCQNDFDLAKNIKKDYKQLFVLENMKAILDNASRLKLKINPSVKAKLVANSTLALTKIQDSFMKMQLLGDEQYALLPDFEKSNITKENAPELIAKLAASNPTSPLIGTLSTYMVVSQHQESHKEQIEFMRSVYNSDSYQYITQSKFQFITGDEEEQEILELGEALDRVQKGETIHLFADSRYYQTKDSKDEVYSLSFDDNKRVGLKEEKAYVFFGEEPTENDLLKEAEEAKLASRQKLFRNHRDRVRYFIDAVRDKLPEKSREYKEWGEKYEEIDDIVMTDEQYDKYEAARKTLDKIKSLETLEIDEYKHEDYPWLHEAHFSLPLEDNGRDKAVAETNKTIRQNNKDVFAAFRIKKEYLDEIEKIKNSTEIPEEEKSQAIFEYYDNKLNTPLELFDNPNAATLQMSKLYSKVKAFMRTDWFDEVADNDDKLIKDWATRKPVFDLILQDNFLDDLKKFGVEITPEDEQDFLSKKFLMTDRINHAQARMDAMSQMYYNELLMLDPTGEARKLISDSFINRGKFEGISKNCLLKAKNFTKTKGEARRAKDFTKHLEECNLLPEEGSLLKGKKFYSYDGTELTQTEALFKMKQSSELQGCLREFAGNDVYIVDEQAKTCKKHSLGLKNGEFKFEDFDYEKFILQKTEIAAKLTSEVADRKDKLSKDNLGVSQNIRALEQIKDSLDNTDFRPFVKNSGEIKNMRTSLDNLIRAYGELKPVPLDSDIKKINDALNEFTTNINAYITYKEHRHHLDDKQKYPNGFEAAFRDDPKNAGKKLTWREKDRLSAAYSLKHLVQNVLKPNVKTDIAQNGLYEQQKRVMLNISNPLPNADITKRMDSELVALRNARKERIDIINKGLKGAQVDHDGFNKDMFRLRGLDAADNMLTLGYDFDTHSPRPQYTEETKNKMYTEIAKVLIYNGISIARANGELKSGEIDLSDGLKADIQRLAESKELRNYIKPENLQPEKILNVVATFRLADGEALNAGFTKFNGSSVIEVLKGIQKQRISESKSKGIAPNEIEAKVNDKTILNDGNEVRGQNVGDKKLIGDKKTDETKLNEKKLEIPQVPNGGGLV